MQNSTNNALNDRKSRLPHLECRKLIVCRDNGGFSNVLNIQSFELSHWCRGGGLTTPEEVGVEIVGSCETRPCIVRMHNCTLLKRSMECKVCNWGLVSRDLTVAADLL